MPIRLLLILLLLSPGLWSQETEEEAPAGTGDATAPVTEVPKASVDDSDSPFDYEASEQISEDLSVSFPVDI